MDNRAMDLNEILVFVRVLQTGSFTAAARVLGAPKSTVSAKVASLERRLGVGLLHRSTRQLNPTEAGAELFSVCAKAIADIESGEAYATRAQGAPKGLLRVTAPVDIAASVLPDFLKIFGQAYPAIQVDLSLSGRVADLVAEGLDVAIRAGKLKDSSLMARKIGISRFCLFASPALLKRFAIKAPRDLETTPCLRFSKYTKGTWALTNEKREQSVQVGAAPSADDLWALKELTVAGLGVALLPIYLARADVKARRLAHVLPGWHANTDDVYLIYPPQKFVQPKVKAFVNEAHERLKHIFTADC